MMKHKMKVSSKLAYVIPAFIVGTMVTSTVALAATSYIQAQKAPTSTISVNGKQISAPRLVYGNTTYTGLWWLQQALKAAGIQATWNGFNFAITTTSTPSSQTIGTANGYQVNSFAQGTTTMVKPDDITYLNGHLFVAYQNGVGSKGEPTKSGVTAGTIVEYNHDGSIVSTWSITGKCDGMAADKTNNRIVATVNEDGNSSMYIVTPGSQQISHLTFSPDPAAAQSGPLATGGGTDSIAFQNGNMYISASAPAADASGNFTHAAVFQGTIQGKTVVLSPVVLGNATATDAVSGNSTTLNLSDPDSSTIVPASSPKFANDLVVSSQGDSELIFLQNPGTASQSLFRLPLGTQVDDTAWATSANGTLYFTDGGSNKVYSLTANFTPGTVFVSSPSDSGVAGFVGTLDLSTGNITPITAGLNSPKGLVFVSNNE